MSNIRRTRNDTSIFKIDFTCTTKRPFFFTFFFFAGPPDPPAGIPNICCSTGTATINWRSSPYDGGCTVTGYTVEMNHAGENRWTTIAESCLSLSITVPSDTVIPGERYCFRVRAENIHGVSEPGDESQFVRIPKEGEMWLEEDEEGNCKNYLRSNILTRLFLDISH